MRHAETDEQWGDFTTSILKRIRVTLCMECIRIHLQSFLFAFGNITCTPDQCPSINSRQLFEGLQGNQPSGPGKVQLKSDPILAQKSAHSFCFLINLEYIVTSSVANQFTRAQIIPWRLSSLFVNIEKGFGVAQAQS